MSSIAFQRMPLDSLHRIRWFDKKMINNQTITGLLSGYKKEHASMVSQFFCWCVGLNKSPIQQKRGRQ